MGSPDRRKGLVLLVGGLVLLVLPTFWARYGIVDLPLALGVVYVVAALAGGQRCALWSAAVVVLAFGAGAELLFRGHLPPQIGEGPAEVASIGVGLVLAELLRRAGYAVDLLGAATTVLLVAVPFVPQRQYGGVWAEPRWYGLAVAVYGLFELRGSAGRSSARRRG